MTHWNWTKINKRKGDLEKAQGTENLLFPDK